MCIRDRLSINDLSSDILIFSKPIEDDIDLAQNAKRKGKKIVVDFCDDHFDRFSFYRAMLELADVITCPTKKMAEKIRWDAVVIHDPYEFDECEPHCGGDNLLWFGHKSNLNSFLRIFKQLGESPFRLVSNAPGTIQWSLETMKNEFSRADIVLMPFTKDYKSPNRTIESIRQGCFVVAEPHPSLDDIPGIWIGDIKEGIEWAKQHPLEANQRTKIAQDYVKKQFSPKIVASAWKKVLTELGCTWDQENIIGKDGSTSTSTNEPMCIAT
jgi:hypothetical protein